MYSIEKILPKWTKKVITDIGGRDPLGLSRVSFIITDYLLTGIITTTDRARYYSFYCWALWHIDRYDDPKKYQDFVDGFRRREAVVAMASVANDPTSSPVGVVAVKSRLEKYKQNREVDSNFRVLPSNVLGGFGQYYSGSLYQLGLYHRLEDGIDRPTQGVAIRLAELYHKSIADTPYIKKKLYERSVFPFTDLEKSKDRLTIESIMGPSSTREREELVDLFFGLNESDADERIVLRRHTLGQILHTIKQYEKYDSPANMKNLEWDLVFPIYYFNVLWPSDERVIKYRCPERFKFCQSLWRQFCLQQFLSQAIEGLMYSVLEASGSESGGLSIQNLIARILQPEYFSTFRNSLGVNCEKPYNLLQALGIYGVPNHRESMGLQKRIFFLHEHSERSILSLEHKTPEASAARAVIMLAVIYGKWRGEETDPGFIFLSNNANSELWVGNVFATLDTWLDREISWENTLNDIISKLILDQHDRVMYEKKRLDSCWLRRIDGRILKEQDYGPRFRSSRHSNAVKIMNDLRLLNIEDNGDITITLEGKKVLKKVLS